MIEALKVGLFYLKKLGRDFVGFFAKLIGECHFDI